MGVYALIVLFRLLGEKYCVCGQQDLNHFTDDSLHSMNNGHWNEFPDPIYDSQAALEAHGFMSSVLN